MPTSIYYSRWVGTSSELGHRRRRGDVGGGVEAQDIGLSYGWGLLQLFQSCGKKKKRKGDKGNEEEGKCPSDGISAAAGMMIRSVHLSSQCG